MDGFEKATNSVSKIKDTRDRARHHFSRKEVRKAWINRLVVSTVILIAILWGGFRIIPSLHNIFNLPNFLDALIILTLISIITRNYTNFGEFEEYEQNDKLKEEISLYNILQDQITDYVSFSKQVREYNAERYEAASLQNRYELIDKYSSKLADALGHNRKGKIKRYTEKLERLKAKEDGEYVYSIKPKKHLFKRSRNFKQYNWQQFLTASSSNKCESIDIDYKSKMRVRKSLNRMNTVRILLLITLRGSLSATFNESLFRFAIFVGIVVLGSVFAAVFAYEWTRDDIANNEIKAIQSKKQELKKILSIDKIEIEEKQKQYIEDDAFSRDAYI